MAFRVVWPGKLGEESSALVDELAGARLIADALASYQPTVYVIDAETSKRAYSRHHKPETGLHSVARRLWTQKSFLFELTTRLTAPRKHVTSSPAGPTLP